MTIRSYRRRRLVVNRALQFRFVRAMLVILVIMAFAAVAAVFVAIRVTLATFELSQDAVIRSLFNVICWLIVLELLIVTPAVIWLGVLLTHKIAGPLVRIGAALAQMTQGDYNVHIQLRRGDELRELAALVNHLAAALRSRRS